MQSRYEIVIYWSDEDDCFLAEVPELPGCMADGANYQEAVRNVEIVIDEWLSTATELGRRIALKTDIAKGVADVNAGRVSKMDMASIKAKGRVMLKSKYPNQCSMKWHEMGSGLAIMQDPPDRLDGNWRVS